MEFIDPRYLAGVIDSDGSISISILHKNRPHPTYRALLQLTWTRTEKTEEFMNRLVSQFGGSFSICRASSNTGYINSKDYLKYSAAGEAGRKICQAISPFLVLKQQQADNFIRLRNIMDLTDARTRTVEQNKILHNLYLENKLLNGKNRK